MTLPVNLNDREQQKFVDVSPGVTSVRVSGENFSGTFRPTGLNVAGRITVVTIDNTTWTALPATALTARNAICIQNRSEQQVKLNYDNTTVGYVGVILDNTGERYYDITDAITIYAKSETSSCTLIVEELS